MRLPVSPVHAPRPWHWTGALAAWSLLPPAEASERMQFITETVSLLNLEKILCSKDFPYPLPDL